MALNRYSIYLIARTAVRIDLPVFQLGYMEFKIHEKGKPDSRVIIEHSDDRQLDMRVMTSQKAINDAMHHALRQSQGVTSLLAFWTRVNISAPRLMVAWEITPGKKDGEFVQLIHGLPLEPPPKRAIHQMELRYFMEGIETKSEEFMYKFTRGVRWYRDALMATNVIDRFLFLWIGMEAIDDLLVDKLNVGVVQQKCRHCKKDLWPRTLQGVKHWIELLQKKGTLPSSKKLFREVNSLRGKLIHAGARLVKIQAEVERALPHIELALDMALVELMGVSDRIQRSKSSILRGLLSARLDATISSQTHELSEDHHFHPSYDLDTEGAYVLCRDNKYMLKLLSPLREACDPRFELKLYNANIVDIDNVNPMLELQLET